MIFDYFIENFVDMLLSSIFYYELSYIKIDLYTCRFIKVCLGFISNNSELTYVYISLYHNIITISIILFVFLEKKTIITTININKYIYI